MDLGATLDVKKSWSRGLLVASRPWELSASFVYAAAESTLTQLQRHIRYALYVVLTCLYPDFTACVVTSAATPAGLRKLARRTIRNTYHRFLRLIDTKPQSW